MKPTNENNDKVSCQTPTPGKKPTRILAWKYDLVRDAILKVLPYEEPGVLFMKELPDLVDNQLNESDRGRLGSVGWYTTTVKLDMEVKGEIMRVAGSKPQRLIRCKDNDRPSRNPTQRDEGSR